MNKHWIRMMGGATALTLALCTSAGAADATPKTTCKDGSTSAATGRGACSGHGGVQKSTGGSSVAGTGSSATPGSASAAAASSTPGNAKAPAATPPPATVTGPVIANPSTAPVTVDKVGASGAAAKSAAPAGATAQCKDGSYSLAKTHSGACSKHGGVASWLDGSK